jgi:hypothetical protein
MHASTAPDPNTRRRRLRGAHGVLVAGLLATIVLAAVGCDRPGTATRRVDLGAPTFSDPTSITNPWFPITEVTQVVQLGEEGGDALRHEITLLPETKVVEWRGRKVETVVSQFVAYGDGRVLEVALDYYAQSDDGSVWYFGEDVDNYEDGVVVDHDGTWLAGRDGPPGMIMPAGPRVGDVYRPENVPGLVFEEVTVTAVDQTVPGPRGPVPGAIRVQERLMDGTLEQKVFAPGYGEFEARVASEGELVTVALAVPTDALPGPVPVPLARLSKGARRVFDTAPSGRWAEVATIADRLSSVWDGWSTDAVTALLEAQMADALEALDAAIAARAPGDVRQAAVDVAHTSLDLQLRHRPPPDVDEDRLGVWRRQLALDREAGDRAGVAGDRAVLDTIEDRTGDTDHGDRAEDDDDGAE